MNKGHYKIRKIPDQRFLGSFFTLLTSVAIVLLSACSRSESGQSVELASRPIAVSGTESSAGGGNAVVCFKAISIARAVMGAHGNLDSRYIDQIQSIEMLDLYHARLPRDRDRSITPVIIPFNEVQDGSPDQYVLRILQRFQTFIPLLARDIQSGQNQITENSFHFSSAGITRINDARSDERLDSNCTLVTMAAQNPQGDQGELIVDSRLYRHPSHSKLSRAILLLHEYLYLVARKQSPIPDSKGIREAIGYLIVKNPKFRINEVVSALNAILPTRNHVFRSTEEYRLFDVIDRQVTHFLTTTYPSYQTRHPEDIRLIERAKLLLDRIHLSCLSNTPMGCLFPIMRATPEMRTDLPEEELITIEHLLVESLRKESEQMKQTVASEWDQNSPLVHWIPTGARGVDLNWHRAVLESTIAGIPMYILPDAGQRLRTPEYEPFFRNHGPFVLIRRADIVEYLMVRWKEHLPIENPEIP